MLEKMASPNASNRTIPFGRATSRLMDGWRFPCLRRSRLELLTTLLHDPRLSPMNHEAEDDEPGKPKAAPLMEYSRVMNGYSN